LHRTERRLRLLRLHEVLLLLLLRHLSLKELLLLLLCRKRLLTHVAALWSHAGHRRPAKMLLSRQLSEHLLLLLVSLLQHLLDHHSRLLSRRSRRRLHRDGVHRKEIFGQRRLGPHAGWCSSLQQLCSRLEERPGLLATLSCSTDDTRQSV